MIHFKKQIIITALVFFSIHDRVFINSSGCLGSLKCSEGSLKNSEEYNKCIKQLKKLCGKSLNATSCGKKIFKKKLYDDFKGDDKIYSHDFYNYLTRSLYLENIPTIPEYCKKAPNFLFIDTKKFIDKCEKILYLYFNTDSSDEVKDAFNFVFKYMYVESKPHFNDTLKKFFMEMETKLEFSANIKPGYLWCKDITDPFIKSSDETRTKEYNKCINQITELCSDIYIIARQCGKHVFQEKLYDNYKGDDTRYSRNFYETLQAAVNLENIPTIPEYCKKASEKRSIKYKPQFIAGCENILNKFFNIDTNILDISDNHKKKCFDFTFISLNQEMYKYDIVFVERFVKHMFKAVSFYNDTKNGKQWCKDKTRT